MKRLICALAVLSLLALSACAMAEGSAAVQEAPKGRVVLYASMQEAQLQALEQAFEAKYPDVDMEYCFAGGGKLVERMTEEARDGGQIAGDLVWLGDPSDFEAFKLNGWLQPYVSPETEHIAEEYIDPEGYFTAARLVSMGIAWNTDLVDESAAPRTWNDLLDPAWSDQIVMTDPSQASTTKYWVAVMMQSPRYGADFFEKLKANGVALESGSTETHNRVADGSFRIGICLDYVSANLNAEGAPIQFHYTEEDIVTMTSPIAMIKGCANEENARLLMDFILSREGQELLVQNNLISVRDDIEGRADGSALAAGGMEVDDDDLNTNLQSYLDAFSRIFDADS